MDATKAERFVRAVWRQAEAIDFDALIQEAAQELAGGTAGALKISTNADFWRDAAVVARGRGLETAAKAFFKMAYELKREEIAQGPGGQFIFPDWENPQPSSTRVNQNRPQGADAHARAKVIAVSIVLGMLSWLAGLGASVSGYFYESVPYYFYVGGAMAIILGIVFAYKVIDD